MAETWVLNATITVPSDSFTASFTSNGTSFTGLQRYNRFGMAYIVSGFQKTEVYVYSNGSGYFVDDAYRTLVFDSSPMGDLLTWLQANGVKQSDPEPETPTNSCMVDGTVYGIKTGQVLVNGTVQTIYNGRTLVGGTGYDIVLSAKNPTITITGTGGKKMAYVVCNGVTYTGATEFTVEPGTMITLYASSDFSQAMATITVDGTIVKSGVNVSYPYAVNSSINVNLQLRAYGPASYGTITVTTT